MSKRDRDRKHDAWRRQVKPWRALYNTMRWQRMRGLQLAHQPLCARCEKRGAVTAATVVHHVERHEGDEAKFWGSALESLCARCHDSDEQSVERRGFDREMGVDGWPIDPKHPANRR